MLQAVYKTSPYVFYLSTEYNRIDTSKTNMNNLLYLFKLTNDMSGEIQYAFGSNQVIENRYSKFELYHNTTPTYWMSRVNLVPNGYWNYELYEYSGDSESGTTCATVPDPATNKIGYYKIVSQAGNIVKSDNFTIGTDLYNQSVEIDYADIGNTDFVLQNTCETVNIETFTAPVGLSVSVYSAFPLLAFDNVAQTATGISFDVVANTPVGYSYTLQQGSGAIVTTNITSDPQTNSYTYSQVGQPNLAANKVQITLLDGSSNPVSISNLYAYPISNPSSYYGFLLPIAVQSYYSISGGTDIKGKIYFCGVYGGAGMETEKNYYTLQGLTTQGKLYVSEPSGEEQVQYTQHTEPSSTNYIWYGE
tara:strand:- start:3247 stop:4332 length:1086 start_codon:yes stop_codon:yes gene_type:complete